MRIMSESRHSWPATAITRGPPRRYLGTLGGRVGLACSRNLGPDGGWLTPAQPRELCERGPQSLAAVAAGARLALSHCQRLFRHEPWNCSLHSFGDTITRGSPETAFVYALHSAGVAHSVARACAAGRLRECSCGPGTTTSSSAGPSGVSQQDAWRWGGCSDDVRAGLRVSRQLGRAAERQQQRGQRAEPLRRAANLHNLKAGRLALSGKVRLRCRCHGVSGSCGLRSCWRSLGPLAVVGRVLRDKYRRSVPLLQRGSRANGPRPRASDLVHVRPSADVCRPGPEGVPVSRGRPCREPRTCDRLCCGRGFETRTVRRLQRCRCRFHWCCYVTCDVCETRLKTYSCR
ncbi:hypothetical protein HPB47_001111 [Ixodes persulcatus]|uniref:Uncharacterized protein n=1 Tax=Ixodes persulcatus TaxID=34615 RepID=A0AC60PQ01_IXOPE|nr:hypothetical protein HPB47_001111 [Ixodes persulcatus]